MEITAETLFEAEDIALERVKFYISTEAMHIEHQDNLYVEAKMMGDMLIGELDGFLTGQTNERYINGMFTPGLWQTFKRALAKTWGFRLVFGWVPYVSLPAMTYVINVCPHISEKSVHKHLNYLRPMLHVTGPHQQPIMRQLSKEADEIRPIIEAASRRIG